MKFSTTLIYLTNYF